MKVAKVLQDNSVILDNPILSSLDINNREYLLGMRRKGNTPLGIVDQDHAILGFDGHDRVLQLALASQSFLFQGLFPEVHGLAVGFRTTVRVTEFLNSGFVKFFEVLRKAPSY